MKNFCLMVYSLLYCIIYFEVAVVSSITIFPQVQKKKALRVKKIVNQPPIYSTDRKEWQRNMNIGDKNNNNKLRISKVSKKIQKKEYIRGM